MLKSSELPRELGTWLQSTNGLLFGDDAEKLRIDVTKVIRRSEANIYFCRASTVDKSRELCVKEYTESSDTEIAALFERSSRLQPVLYANNVISPSFIACNPDLAAIVMSFEHGESLETLIVQSFFRGPEYARRCIDAMGKLADSQSALSRSAIPSDVSLATPCSNQEYVNRIQEFLEHPFVRDCLTIDDVDPEQKIDSLPADFWQRHEKCLLHGDFQAKNVLVGHSESIILIDLDFGRGHPLFDVAQLLTQLLRLSRRWRFPKATRLTKLYGDHFVEQFARNDYRYLLNDLPFFMIWSMTFSLLGDAHYPRPIRSYIKQHLRNSVLAKSWGLTGELPFAYLD